MKLRKILARSIAVIACMALLSTNVLAATVDVTPNEGKAQVTISDVASGEVTVLAINHGAKLSTLTGEQVQYINQFTADGSDVVFNLSKRNIAGATDKATLYIGGAVSDYTAKTVYFTDGAELVDTYAFEYEADGSFATASAWADADVKAFLDDLGAELKVNTYATGDDEATEVSYSDATKADFTFTNEGTKPETENVVLFTVAYKGTALGNIEIVATVPAAITALAITAGLPSGPIVKYVNELTDFDAVATVKAISGLEITATYDDADATEAVLTNWNKIEVVAEDSDVTAGSKTVTAKIRAKGTDVVTEESIVFTVNKKAITSIVENDTNTNTMNLYKQVSEIQTADTIDAYLESLTSAQLASEAGFKATYNWNDGATSSVEAADLDFAVVAGDEDDTFVATVSANKGIDFAVAPVINITVEYGSSMGIMGSVRVNDSTEEVSFAFINKIPVGAVVTAYPYNEDGMGNVQDTEDGFDMAYAAIVGNDGTFTLELAPGEYTVVVSHTKYAIYGMSAADIYVSKTILDENSVQVVEVVDTMVDMGTIQLRYAFRGDLDLDGTVDAADYVNLTTFFKNTVSPLN